MTQLELPQEDLTRGQEVTPAPSLRRAALVRGLTVAVIVVLSGFLVIQGRNLWLEWNMLQQQVSIVQANPFIGYPDIAPQISHARSPENWFHEEGKETLLWSRWEKNVGHSWFRFASGDIDKALLMRPSTEVVSRAIDTPIVETRGGAVWKRIPGQSQVVVHNVGGVNCVYPVHVLSKVQVINDVVDDRPLLITINLLARMDEAFSIFEANLDGRRVTMASSGYYSNLRPLLYDRGTESLWIEDGDVLKSLAGKSKGRQLTRVAKPVPVTWDSWLAKNPRGRLVIGADRSQAIPAE
jgi:Protein of unknown function (DUF3179)